MKGTGMKKAIVMAIIALFSASALAGSGYGGGYGGGEYGGEYGGGHGRGPETGVSGPTNSSSSSANGSASDSSSVAAGGSSNATGTQTMQGGDYRSLSLSGGSVGSPANDTCAAHASGLFGLFTVPVVLDDCRAVTQSKLLWSYGLKEAAVSRLCSIKEIRDTGICPVVEKTTE